MSLKPSLLQAEKHQFSLSSYERCSSPLLIFMALWIHSNRLNLYCTEDSSPGCNTAAGVSQEDRVEEANHLFPRAVYSSLKAVQDTGGLLYSKCLLLAQFQLFFPPEPPNPSLQNCTQWVLVPELTSGIASTQVQLLSLGLGSHEVLMGPLLKL